MSTHRHISETLGEFASAFARHDLAALSAMFAPGDSVLLYGTQANLHFIGWDAIHASLQKQLATLDEIELAIDTTTMTVCELAGGQVACVGVPSMSFAGSTGGRTIGSKAIRMTCVLERREGRWLFVQMHWSLADPAVLVDMPDHALDSPPPIE